MRRFSILPFWSHWLPVSHKIRSRFSGSHVLGVWSRFILEHSCTRSPLCYSHIWRMHNCAYIKVRSRRKKLGNHSFYPFFVLVREKRRCILQNGKLEMFFWGEKDSSALFFADSNCSLCVFHIFASFFCMEQKTYLCSSGATYKNIEALRMHFLFCAPDDTTTFPR